MLLLLVLSLSAENSQLTRKAKQQPGTVPTKLNIAVWVLAQWLTLRERFQSYFLHVKGHTPSGLESVTLLKAKELC